MERERLLEKIKKASYFSILIDGATDSAKLENELIYIRYLSTEGPVNSYLSIEDVKNGNAAGVLDTIYAGSDEIKHCLEKIRNVLLWYCVCSLVTSLFFFFSFFLSF